MMRIGKSELAMRRNALLTMTFTGLVVATTLIWALLPVAKLALPKAPSLTVAAQKSTLVTHEANLWQVNLWRPFRDIPPPPPKPVPITMKVFSILRRAEGLIAAIDPGAGGGLIYAKVGEKIGEFTITAIDERGIEVEHSGNKQRVELRP
jgi:hypothetical protein